MKLAKNVLPVVMVFSLAGCGTPGLDEPDLLETRSDALWMIPGAVIWPHSGSGAGPSNIRVCFRGTDFDATQRDTIRKRVEDSWERVAHLNFHDWGVCPNPAPTSNVVIVKHNPNLGAFGTSDGGFIATRANAIEFFSKDPDFKTTVHEFGHTLGFHEENSNALCWNQTQGTSLEGQQDVVESVMTQGICNTTTALSNWDILGVRKVYGLKPPRSIVGVGGLTIGVANNSSAIGAAVIGNPAQGADYDKWLLHPTTQQLRASPSGAYRCLTIQGGVVGSGFTPLNSWSCDGAQNQLWHFTGVQWRAMGKMCVGASYAGVGATLTLQHCTGADAPLKTWDFFEGTTTTGAIRLSGTNLCVRVPNGSTALGTLLNLATCSGSSDQSFSKVNGRIPWGDKCFNVMGGTAAPGNQIGLWNGCDANPPLPNSVFTIAGKLTGLSGQCVTMGSAGAVDGVQMGVSPCQSPLPASQTWETYW